jgi:hypothetical protein
MNYSIKRTVLAIALFGAFGAANATVLVVDVPVNSVDTVATFFGGTLLDSAITNVTSPSYTGTARSAVYDTGSGLDFYYQFSNDASSDTGIQRLSAYDFSALLAGPVEVFQTASAFGIFNTGTENADAADRTINGVIGFSFIANTTSKIEPGTSSFTQIIRTQSREYVAGTMGILNGSASNAVAFAPAMPVPEPESFAMLLAGLGLMGTIARRRTRNNRT